jgi:hypothetical protein
VRPVPDVLDPNGWWIALVGETSRDKPAPEAVPFYLWVDSVWNDRWEARKRRAANLSLNIAMAGGGIALASGIATCASGYGSKNEFGAIVFITVGLISAAAAATVQVALSPRHRSKDL